MARKQRRSSFGQVFRRPRKDGTYYPGWWVRFVEGGRRVQRFGGTSKELAEDYLAARRLERVHDRIRGVPGVERVKVSDFVPVALTAFAGTHRKGGMGSLTSSLNLFKTAFPDHDLVDIHSEDVDAFLTNLRVSKGYAHSTLRTVRAHVSGLFTYAMKNRKARSNPCKGVKLARPDETPRIYLETPRLVRIYAAVPAADGLRACAILCGEAGLRRNEAVYLRWREVGPGMTSVTVEGDRAKGHRARTVPLTARAREALQAHKERIGTVSIYSDARVFGFTEHRFGEVFRAAM